ncbi:hypothetical protein Fmac_011442 [Flemingia macrophylla]|uniref:non-specific serine/threonine protein kinase n=1 Tax=Flemingia macrophylla TaxID=520843 RepID=A0ABD1MMF6_9FABA
MRRYKSETKRMHIIDETRYLRDEVILGRSLLTTKQSVDEADIHQLTKPNNFRRRTNITIEVIDVVSRQHIIDVVPSQHRKENGDEESPVQNLFAIWSFDGKMVYENIIEATKEFDDKHLIGVGGQGSVYKAELNTGPIVAVKKFHLIQNEEIYNVKAFTSEIQALTEIRHRNIVKLYGFCSHSRFSFLVYEFLENGSMDKILQDDEQAIAFDWNKRTNAIKGVACALCYMHHDCSPPIIHRDISSKNVLLDLQYAAYLSDVGTIKLLNPVSTNWTSFVGTLGYAAPG